MKHEIRHEIKRIEDKLDNPCFGLAEIKREIRAIENKLDVPRHGLGDIKEEIRDIEDKLDSPCFGLAEIKREIKAIEDKLDDRHFGLEEIKREIHDIEDKLDHQLAGSSVLTTGPVIRSAGVGNLYVKILNNTAVTQSVRITLFNIQHCPKQPADSRTVTLFSKCSDLETFDIGSGMLDLEEFEVQLQFLSGATHGILAFVAGAEGGSVNLVAANVFRHSELVPQVSN